RGGRRGSREMRDPRWPPAANAADRVCTRSRPRVEGAAGKNNKTTRSPSTRPHEVP
ncbi:Hypothetical predicted protein, partial [Pelobates cultripes]